ncbi:hypothetical protein WJX72_010146 [[Myrmecia] bisecta]|uniref:Uncharacterized protein n=1 Tax=[Myrmecia] bisecta TaxID=41462 RepID=A0AAW1QSD8_9CHLO
MPSKVNDEETKVVAELLISSGHQAHMREGKLTLGKVKQTQYQTAQLILFARRNEIHSEKAIKNSWQRSVNRELIIRDATAKFEYSEGQLIASETNNAVGA